MSDDDRFVAELLAWWIAAEDEPEPEVEGWATEAAAFVNAHPGERLYRVLDDE